jgi:tRNA A-37 threonylcarbamoyl transferase component Bud32
MFALVKLLHRAGVVHGDLEPRNVVRTAKRSFLLIDFTESTTHHCPDNDSLTVHILLSLLLLNLHP